MTYETRDELPRSVCEMRGMPAIDRDRERPFSPASYAAQYGITIEDAQDLVASSNSHPQIHRQILAMFKADRELKERALMLGDRRAMTDDEKRVANTLLARLGLSSLPGEAQSGA